MKIAVLMKQTFDTEAKIDLDNTGQIVKSGIKQIMNPYDEYAVEEAIRLKEAQGGEVTVVSLGPDTTVEAIRQALAMGCDRAVLLNDPLFQRGDEYSSAKVIAAAFKKMEYDLILAGWVAVDDGSAQVATRVGEILDIPQITMVTKLVINQGMASGEREIEGAVVTVEVPLPALVTVQKGINEPRYPSMKGIMAAKKKEIKKITANDLEFDAGEIGKKGTKSIVKAYFLPPKRKSCKTIDNVIHPDAACQLVKMLREEIKVI
ncbi:MAG: electron transfer flavoprotein subunit beta/FixA family protein [Dehalobacterium sp.]